jgi:sodium-dependent dicarboxylate transporter 2/3/5
MAEITLQPNQPNQAARRRSVTICVLTAAVAVAAYYLLPSDMNELARRTITIFIVAAVFWATEALPLYATSLCIIGLEILFLADHGGLAQVLPARSAFPVDETGMTMSLSSSDFLQSFASPIIILFMGGFLMSSAVTKHGLDRVIGAKLLRPFSHKPITLVFGVLCITAFFSMWMSNTATTAMMLAIITPLVRDLPKDDRFHRAVILAVPFGANIGGIGTPIGTPPNAVALAALRMEGYQIGFIDWMMLAVPLVLIMLTVTGFLLYRFFPPTPGMPLPEVPKAREISGPGRMTLIILACTIVLWMTSKWHGVNDAVIALIAAAALTALRVLDRRDVDSIDWNVLLLMWGGLSLGDAMIKTGMVGYIIDLPVIDAVVSLPGPLSGVLLAVIIVVLSITMASFMSHTAAAALIVPVALALSADQAGQLVILTALSTSFAMAMPISTPPNAMAFATGQVPVGSMIRSGGLISMISVLVLLAGYQLILPLFLKLSHVPMP